MIIIRYHLRYGRVSISRIKRGKRMRRKKLKADGDRFPE